ncbi:hypothetical protein LI044_11115, partial [Clostridium perfringens]|nr:hypothetical protein [Clostridium perfringens]
SQDRDCKLIDFYHLIVDDKKYYLRDQNLTPEGAKCIQNAILIPVDEYNFIFIYKLKRLRDLKIILLIFLIFYLVDFI